MLLRNRFFSSVGAFARRATRQPASASATLILAITAGMSLTIYAMIFARLSFLPDVWNTPIVTGSQISLRTIDGGHGLARFQLITGFAALGVLYFFAYRAAKEARDWIDTSIVAFGALAFGLVLLFMYPFGAADIFDNITHGRMIAFYNANPFQQVANDFRGDPFLPYAAWRTSKSAYGPVWEIMAGATSRLAGDGVGANIVMFKLLPGLFWVLTLVVAWKMLQRAGRRPTLPAFLLLAWNPLILYEVWGNGHNDMAMAFFVLLAAWMVMEKRFTLAVGALVAGALVKYIPLLLIPLAGVIALRALPTWRRRGIFVLSSAALSVVLIVVTFQPFWVGWDTLTIGRRATMLSGTLASAVHSILVDGPAKLPKEATAKDISLVLAALTGAVALIEAWRVQRRPNWEGFIQHSFNIYMVYLLVTVPWFQQWYAIWPLVFLPFLDAPARGLALVFGFAVLGKQLWVDPSLYWSRRWAPLPAREIGFALGNLAIPWLYALFVIRDPLVRAYTRLRQWRRAARPLPRGVLVPVTGPEDEDGEGDGRA
jgi:hypothetical protein